MKGTMKLLSVLLLTVMVLTTMSHVCYAAGSLLNVSDINIDYGSAEDTKDIRDKAGKVIGLIRNIAVIAGVILISVLGLKYMFGSAEEKAGYQKSFVPLIVGIIIVMAATTIASMIFNLVN